MPTLLSSTLPRPPTRPRRRCRYDLDFVRSNVVTIHRTEATMRLTHASLSAAADYECLTHTSSAFSDRTVIIIIADSPLTEQVEA